jgi:hypothetical protein
MSQDSVLSNPNLRLDQQPEYTREELELFHHFSTITCIDIAQSFNQQRVWQVNICRLAFDHEYLMDGIFAIAALHKAFDLKETDRTDSEKWIESSTAYINKALASFRIDLQNITTENCGALLALTSLLSLFVLGFSRKPDLGASDAPSDNDETSGLDKYEWLPLIRGGIEVLKPWMDWIRESPVGCMIPARDDKLWHPDLVPLTETEIHIDQKLSQLQSFWTTDAPRTLGPLQTPQLTEAQIGSLNAALDELKLAALRLSNTQRMLDQGSPNETPSSIVFDNRVAIGFMKRQAVMTWLYCVDNTFVHLLHTRHPAALLLLVYFAMLIDKLDKVWWLSDVPKDIVQSTLPGLGTNLAWIEWPLQELGLDMPY